MKEQVMYLTTDQGTPDTASALCEFAIGETKSPRQGLSPRAMARVLRFIDEHLCEGLSLQDLADAACVSRFHFARQFRASTGFSPMEFVLKARIEAGRQMLSSGEQKIAAVAATLGFFDQSHFTRTFRRVMGVPPRTFARQLSQTGVGADDRFGRATGEQVL